MVLIETTIFTRQPQSLMRDEEYRKLRAVLVNTPTLGPIIQGSGGLRKARWALPGKGKSGGVRVIYYWATAREHLLMLVVYAKAERDDLSAAQLAVLRKLVEEKSG